MKKIIRIIILLFVSFQCLSSIAQIQKAEGIVTRIEGKTYISKQDKLYEIDDKVVLVKLKHGSALPEKDVRASHIAFNYYSISVPDSIDVEKYVMILEKTNIFEYVEYNSVFSPCMSANDYYFNTQWHLSRINANAAWEITTGSPSVKVAVIDDGVELDHPDLYYGNENYTNLSVTESVDYLSSTDHTPATSHGTMVAGVIGAKTNNSVGVAGVAGGYGCSGVTIISYRTNCTTSQVSSAIYNAISKGVKVINISLGGDYNQTLSYALDYAYNNGVTVVCPSGNGNSSSLLFPASHQYTIAVGGTNSNNELSNSHYGSGLDLVAPRSGIWSTCKNSEGSYTWDSGTSLAAPQVAAVAALMLSVNPNLSPDDIRDIINNTATKINPSIYTYDSSGWNEYVGHGLLNACAAIIVAKNYSISGLSFICNSSTATYTINNLPSGFTVGWSFTNGFGPTAPSIQYSGNTCYITNNLNKTYAGTLNADIKYGGVSMWTLKKEIVVAYAGFYGLYCIGSGTPNQEFYPNTTIWVTKGSTVHLKSPNLLYKNVSYSVTTPSSWQYYSYTGEI